jgi:hypothetical protein
MRKKMSCSYLVVFCVLIGFSFSGCAALVGGGVGAGAAYNYVRGWLEKDYEVPLEQAHTASLAAVENLGMTITEDTRQVGSTRIKAIKDDRTNWISLEAKGENLTTISVRSGLLGDETASETIHREIEKNLKRHIHIHPHPVHAIRIHSKYANKPY